MIPQHWITGNATRGTYQQKEIFLQSRKHAKRQGNTHEERVDWALALTMTACRRSFVSFAGRAGRQSLGQVVEADRHADVAGKADVDAEVNEPVFARAWIQTAEATATH